MLDSLQTRLLTWIAPGEPTHMSGSAFKAQSKLAILLGEQMLAEVRGRDVIDFGCGEGAEAVELAQHGANVFGIDIRESVLTVARRRAEEGGVAARCRFGMQIEHQADIIVSLDSFEHFADPAAILRVMHDALRPGGKLLAAFGPTWYHPYGGHLFSVFPWAHLLFSERSLIDWRCRIRSDGARRFSEVEGGLNQMTIARFEALAAASPFKVESIEPVPIRRLVRLHNRLTREFFTSVVRARLRKES